MSKIRYEHLLLVDIFRNYLISPNFHPGMLPSQYKNERTSDKDGSGQDQTMRCVSIMNKGRFPS